MLKLFNKIDIHESFKDTKHRQIYILNFENSKYEIIFDNYIIIPEFAEIEVESIELLTKILNVLKISDSDLFFGSKKELFKKYLKD